MSCVRKRLNGAGGFATWSWGAHSRELRKLTLEPQELLVHREWLGHGFFLVRCQQYALSGHHGISRRAER